MSTVTPLRLIESRSTRTHCPYCAFQCGMTMTISRDDTGDESMSITGDETFPVNRGQMCVKGFTAAALLTHPARLTAPLIRGADGALHPATWDDALNFVAERLATLRDWHGAEALAAFGSGALTNEKVYALGKFVRLVLGSPHIDYNGRYCMSSAAAAQTRAFGLDRGLPFPVSDIAETGTLMLWGSNCADTMPPIMQWIAALQEGGGTLVVVDPRRTETARAAALHLQLAPGTDLALADGLLHIAIEEGLVDCAYVAERTEAFDDVRRSVLTSDPTAVERITGVPVSAQRHAVRLLAEAERSMLLSGRGPEQQSKGTDTVLALINLMLALGKVGKPASGYGCLTGQGNGQGGREHGQKADQLPGYRSIENEDDRRAIARIWGMDVERLPRTGKSAVEILDACGPDAIRALLVFGSNVAVASPDATHVKARLRELDLLVVCDAFENDTSDMAHVVLPTTQWAEENGSVTNLEGRVILRSLVRPAPEGVRTDIEVIAGLAARLGYRDAFPYQSSREVFDELRRASAGAPADYSGMSYERIARHQGLFWPCPSFDHPGTPRLFADDFPRRGGRARFHVVPYRPSAEPPDAEYPLFFTTGRYREHYNSGAQTRRVAALVEARPMPRVEVHPDLAARLGVSDGDPIVVESRRGQVSFVVASSPDIRIDTLFAPFHWGGRQAANTLTNAALDPTSRMPEFKVCAVRARAAGADDNASRN